MENSAKGKRFGIIAFATVCLIQFVFTGIVYNPLSVYTGTILEEFPQFTRAQYALSFTMMSFICAIVNLFLGKINALIKSRGVVVLGGTLLVISMIIYANAHSLAAFYAAALIVGVAFAFVASAIGATIINKWFFKNSGTFVGISLLFSGVGGTIFSPVIGSWIESFGWRQSFTIVAIIAAVSTVLIGIFFRSEPESVGVKPMFYEEKGKEDDKPAELVYGMTLKEGVRTFRFWAVIVVYLIVAIVVYSILSIISVYVQDLGYSAAEAGAALAPMNIVNMFMPFVIGFLADHMDTRWVVAGGVLLFSVALFILLTGPSLMMVYVVAALTGIGMATGRSTLPMVTRSLFGTKDYASFIGIFVGVFSGGIAIGNYVIAAFYDRFGNYASAMYAYIPAAIIAIVLAVITFRGKKA